MLSNVKSIWMNSRTYFPTTFALIFSCFSIIPIVYFRLFKQSDNKLGRNIAGYRWRYVCLCSYKMFCVSCHWSVKMNWLFNSSAAHINQTPAVTVARRHSTDDSGTISPLSHLFFRKVFSKCSCLWYFTQVHWESGRSNIALTASPKLFNPKYAHDTAHIFIE